MDNNYSQQDVVNTQTECRDDVSINTPSKAKKLISIITQNFVTVSKYFKNIKSEEEKTGEINYNKLIKLLIKKETSKEDKYVDMTNQLNTLQNKINSISDELNLLKRASINIYNMLNTVNQKLDDLNKPSGQQ